ncbi:MAG: hypothetical protein VZR09_02510 [Candidatus Gastranaerophilaceae bacterium]|nr:hypothetical protein [Candidatus Gastranaerophilaceae bacterium]
MDYNLLKTNISGAFDAFGVNNVKLNEHMRAFYSEGIKNTSVASMIMRDELVKSIHTLDNENDMIAHDIRLSIKNPCFDGGNYGMYKFNLSKGKLKFITNAGKILEVLEHRLSNRVNKDTLYLKDAFDREFQLLYPKTGYIRKYLMSMTDVKYDMLKKYCKK